MGWASGSYIMDGIISAAMKGMPDESVRKEFYKEVIGVLEGEDWDTQDECIGEDDALDSAMKELHPTWFDDKQTD